MKSEIEDTLKRYLHAYYQQDFDTMLSMLYEDDIIEYHSTFVSFAEKMDVFGETEDFLKKIKIKDIPALKALSVKEFMISIFQMVTREVGKEDLKKMIEGVEITHIDDTELISIVTYRMPFELFGEWDSLESQVTMINSGGNWKLFFKSGLGMVLESFEKEIDQYNERKSRDNLENLKNEHDLQTYTLTGYKNSEGDIVFEARFKEAGEFSEGLAYVKIMEKYGYINLKGEIEIKPQFWDAGDFSEQRASVKVYVEGEGKRWGFIDPKGQMVIPPIYESTSDFSEGLCAVKIDEKWGYIDPGGNTIIQPSFYEAGDFEGGIAYVELLTENGEFTEMTLDREGNIID